MNQFIPTLLRAILLSVLLINVVNAHEQIQPHVSVTGAASLEVTPDIIQWQLNIKNEHLDVEKVAKEHGLLVANVLSFLQENGIKKDNIQTTNMRFNEKYRYEQRNNVRDGFSALTQLSFSLTKVKNYQKIWLGLSKLTGVNIQNVNYETSKRVELQNETRIKALLAAKEKAQVLVKALNVDIGNPIAIEEHSGTLMVPAMEKMRSFNHDMAVNNSSLSLGKITIKMTVNAKFEIQTLINR